MCLLRHPVAAWVVLDLAFITSPVSAGPPADWPHVRGPNYDAHAPATGLADAWPEGGPPVLWDRDLGQGYSGLVVAGGRLFTQFQTKTGAFVTALDPDSGAEVWRRRVGWPWQPAGPYPGPYATPTWHAGRVYYATPTGAVGCLDAADGRAVWEVEVRKRFASRGTEFGFAATPLVEGGRVILPVGGEGASLVALNAADGSIAWAAGHDQASYCPAFPFTLGGRRLVIGVMRNVVVAHDPTTGRRVWRHRLSRDYDEHSAWPLAAGAELLVATPFRAGSRLYRFAAAGDEVTGRELWAGRGLSCDVCSPVLVGGFVYGFDLRQAQAEPHRPSRGAFKCVEFATGAVKWETEDVGQVTIVVADGKLVMLDESGWLVLARSDPGGYAELARVRVFGGRGLCWSPPAVWGKRVFVRNQSRAMCLYLGRPEDLGPARPPGPRPSPDPGFDWTRLVPHDPEFPNDAPTAGEVRTWFWWCVLGVFGPAAVIGGVAGLSARRLRAARPRAWAEAVFAGAAVALGAAGTTAVGAWAGRFVLTWPAAVYVAFRLTIGAGVRARGRSLRARVAARAALAGFVGLCYGYYLLCVAVGYVAAWGFLAGLLPAAPFAVVAARTGNWRGRAAAEVAGFAVYFWASGLLPGWKDRWAD